MISIIIPAHNEQTNLTRLLPYLTETIKDENTEIIVVLSAANTDDSLKIPHSTSIKLIQSVSSGRALQMNYGAQISEGDYLVFLHADVIPPSTFIADIQETLATTFDAGFFSYKFDKENFLLSINASFTVKDGIFTGGGDQCLFIKKNVFMELGGFNQEQVIMEDFEFFKRMKKNNINYKIVKNNLIVSARKYETNSYLRVNATNLLLVMLFNFGYSAKNLKKVHQKLLKTPYNKI